MNSLPTGIKVNLPSTKFPASRLLDLIEAAPKNAWFDYYQGIYNLIQWLRPFSYPQPLVDPPIRLFHSYELSKISEWSGIPIASILQILAEKHYGHKTSTIELQLTTNTPSVPS